MVCSDMSSTSASAKISWPSRCAVANLMSAKLNRGKADGRADTGATSFGIRDQHRLGSPARSLAARRNEHGYGRLTAAATPLICPVVIRHPSSSWAVRRGTLLPKAKSGSAITALFAGIMEKLDGQHCGRGFSLARRDAIRSQGPTDISPN
jgi:hypothetical protein